MKTTTDENRSAENKKETQFRVVLDHEMQEDEEK